MILIVVNVIDMIIKKNFLQFNVKYRLEFFVIFLEGIEGFVMFEFVIVGKLYSGYCVFLVDEGVVFQIEFIFECFEW